MWVLVMDVGPTLGSPAFMESSVTSAGTGLAALRVDLARSAAADDVGRLAGPGRCEQATSHH